MNIWLITDTHFNHEKLKTMGAGRPANYEERIWKSLKAIPEIDTLIHLGDICIGNDEAIHKELFEDVGCKKILVKGNHDNKSDNWYYEHGWDFVCQETVIKAFGKMILLRHIPILARSREDIDMNIHGHLHGTNDRANRKIELYDHNWHYDVAPDTHDYQAVSLKSIVERKRI